VQGRNELRAARNAYSMKVREDAAKNIDSIRAKLQVVSDNLWGKVEEEPPADHVRLFEKKKN
jgi:hypothetical protein